MANNNKSLEIRINSLDDAKAVVSKQASILAAFATSACDSIEFLIAEEIKTEANALIRGVFRVKNYTSYTSPRDGNKLFQLPHLKVLPVRVAPAAPPMVVPVTAMPRKRNLAKLAKLNATAQPSA